MQSEQQRHLEASSYYAVVKALYACGKLESFDSELLLVDLQQTFEISAEQHLNYLNSVKQDEEASTLSKYLAEASAPSRMTTEPPRLMAMPPALSIPHFDGHFHHHVTPAPSSKSRSHSKKPSTTPRVKGGSVSKSSSHRKSGSGTPATTPRSSKGKPAPDRRTSMASAAATLQLQALTSAEAELARLNNREREIFETLVNIGVKEEDPELNEVHRTLLKWYRLDMRQRQIEKELETMA